MDIKFLNAIGKNFRGSDIKLIENRAEFFFLSEGFLISFNFLHKKIRSFDFGLQTFITAFDIQQSNNHALILDQNNNLMLMDFKLKKIKTKITFKNQCLKVKWSPIGIFFALSVGNYIQLWKTSLISKKFSHISLTNTFIINCRLVLDLHWDQGGKFLVTGGDDGSIQIFRLRNRTKLYINWFLLHLKEIQIVKIYSKQMEIWVLNRKNILKKFKCSRKKLNNQHPFFFFYSCKLKKENGLLTVSEIKPESSLIIQGYANGILVFFEIPEEKKKFSKIFKKENYRTKILTPFKKLELLKIQISSLCVSKNLGIILIGSYKNQKVVILDKFKPITILSNKAQASKFTAVDISPNEKLICTGNSNGTLQIWSLNLGLALAIFNNHFKCILKTIFLKKTSRFLLSCSADGSLKIFDLKKLIIIKTMENHARSIGFEFFDINYSNKLLVGSCNTKQGIYIWSLKTGNLKEVLSVSNFEIVGLQFIGRKNQFISNDKNGSFKLWNLYLSPTSSLKISCKIININVAISGFVINPISDHLVVFSISGLLLIFICDTFELIEKFSLYPKLSKKVLEENNPLREKTIIKYSKDGKFILLNNRKKIFLILTENPTELRIFGSNSEIKNNKNMIKNLFPFKPKNFIFNKNTSQSNKILSVQGFYRSKNWLLLFDDHMVILGTNKRSFRLKKNYYLPILEKRDYFSIRMIQDLISKGYFFLLKSYFQFISSKKRKIFFFILKINSIVKKIVNSD